MTNHPCEFWGQSFEGWGRGGGQIFPFPIGLSGRPYNSHTLSCKCVIMYVNWKLRANNDMSEVANVAKLSDNNELCNLITQNVITSLIKIYGRQSYTIMSYVIYSDAHGLSWYRPFLFFTSTFLSVLFTFHARNIRVKGDSITS